jgi:hypothetical protein
MTGRPETADLREWAVSILILGLKRAFLSVFSDLHRKFKVAERIDGPEESPFPLSDVPVRTRGVDPL